ncbi:MAG: hypothetical protein QXH59_08205 [Candidatus Caldarchaeum sp.]
MPKRSGAPLLAGFVVFVSVLLAIVVAAYIVLPMVKEFVTSPTQPPIQPPSQPPPQPQAPPGKLQLQVQDIDTGAALGGGGSTKIDVVDPADLTRPKETITVDTTTKVATSALLYQPGQRLLLHIYSSEGNGYYPADFEITVPSTYTLSGNQYIYFLGAFGLKQRVAAASVKFTLFAGATALSSATGAADGSQGSYTAGASVFDLSVQINLDAYKSAWGKSVTYINARFEKVTLQPVVWVAFNNTAVSPTRLTQAGWTPVTSTAFTGWIAFYRVLTPVESTQTSLGSLSIPIPVDTTSVGSGKKVLIYVWISDMQNVDDARAGIATSALTAYGAYSGYGLTTFLRRGFSTSGSAPANPVLQALITTA